jgi:hypothetical protein
MERLTRRNSKNYPLLKGNRSSYGSCSYDCQTEEGITLLNNALEKLAAYEDLEEKGLLLKLPCNLNTPVYVIEKVDLSIGDYTHIDYCIVLEKFNANMIDAFGKDVFLTEDEAERVLEEWRKNK